MSQRDSAYSLSPPWLRIGVGEKYVYNLGLLSDALLEKMNQAMLAPMPGLGTDTALPLIGADNVMTQGPGETDDDFAFRLTRAYETWQRAGSRPAILKQALGYVGLQSYEYDAGNWIAGAIVQVGSSAWASWSVYFDFNTFASDEPFRVLQGPSNWNWDGNYYRPQAFLILYFPTVDTGLAGTVASIDTWVDGFVTLSGLDNAITADVGPGDIIDLSGAASPANNGTFQIVDRISDDSLLIALSDTSGVYPDPNSGAIVWAIRRFQSIAPRMPWSTTGGTWGDGGSWGLNTDAGYVLQLQNLVRLWKSAGTHYPAIFFSFYGADGGAAGQLAPYGAAGTNNPDGDWGRWAKNVDGVMVPARKTSLSTNTEERWLACAAGSQAYFRDCYEPLGT